MESEVTVNVNSLLPAHTAQKIPSKLLKQYEIDPNTLILIYITKSLIVKNVNRNK